MITLETLQSSDKEINDSNYGMYLSLVRDTYLTNPLSIESKLVNQKPLTEALDFKSKLPEQLAKLHLAISTKNYADKNASISLNTILKTLNDLKILFEKELE